MDVLQLVEKAGSLDIFSVLSDLPKYIINIYKTKKEEKEAQAYIIISTAVVFAANINYPSFRVFCPKKPEELYKEIEQILFELDVRDISIIAREDTISKFINKFKESRIIDVETVNGDGCIADLEQFYSQFEINFRRILNNKIYDNDTNYRKVLMKLQEIAVDNSDDMKEKLDNIHKVLEEMRESLQEVIDNEIYKESNKIHSPKVIVISRGEYNKEDYDMVLDLRGYFDHRFINNAEDWNAIKEEIQNFSQELKKKSHVDNPYTLYLSTHLSIAYCLGGCLNGKGNYGVNVIQITQSKPLDWSIDSSKSKEEFEDKLFNIISYKKDEEINDVAVCVSTRAASIYEDAQEFLKANDISVNRIIDFNLGDKGGNKSVESGTHGWYLSNQVRDEISKRSFKERKGNLHLFMAVPVSMPFFLGQLSFDFKNIILYEHTTSPEEKDIYVPSIFIKNADELS